MAPVGWLIKAPCGLSLSACARHPPPPSPIVLLGGEVWEKEGRHRALKNWSDYLITYCIVSVKQATQANSKLKAEEIHSLSWQTSIATVTLQRVYQGWGRAFFFLANYHFIRFLQYLIELGTLSAIYKWGNWGSEKWNNLPKVLQLVSGISRI